MTAPGPLHLRITAFDEASPVLRLTREQVEQFAAGLSSSMSDAGRSVLVLSETERRLTEQHHLGRLSATDYARAHGTLKADISELANTTKLTVTEQERLASTGKRVEQTLVGLSRAEIRTVDAADLLGTGVGTLTQVMQGNIGAATTMATTLQRFTIGAPLITMGLGALAALVAGWVAIEGAAKKAEEAELRAHQARATRIGSVRLSGRERAEAFERLVGSATQELAGLEGAERAVPEPITQVAGAGSVGSVTATVVINQRDIDAARDFNRELERRRRILEDTRQIAQNEAAEARRGLARAAGGDRGEQGRERAVPSGGLTPLVQGGVLPWGDLARGELRQTAAAAIVPDEREREQLARWQEAQDAAGDGLARLGGGMGTDALRAAAEATGNVVAQVNALREGTQGAVTDWAALASQLDQTLQAGTLSAITGVLSGSVQGLSGFGKQFARVLGGVMITAGQSAIGIGTFSELIRKALTNLFGGGGVAAIAGGAALIALGGMIQRAAGNAASGVASGFGGGSAAGSGGTGTGFDGSLAGAGTNQRRTIEVYFPADNQVLNPRNRAIMEWFAELAAAVDDANLVIRTATP